MILDELYRTLLRHPVSLFDAIFFNSMSSILIERTATEEKVIMTEDIYSKNGFESAVESLMGLLFSVSYSILADRERCLDAVQNALTNAWEKRFSLRDPEKFRNWLVRIVINETRRLRKHRQTIPLPDVGDITSNRESEITLDVQNAVFSLDERYRLPVVLFYCEGWSVQEIGEALGLPKGTVVSRLSRAREMLRKELKAYDV